MSIIEFLCSAVPRSPHCFYSTVPTFHVSVGAGPYFITLWCVQWYYTVNHRPCYKKIYVFTVLFVVSWWSRSIPKTHFFLFCSPLSFSFSFFCLSSLIIHLFFLDAKTTTNRTTAQIMYSVKSSLSGGGEGDSENVHWSETREHPDRERLNVTPHHGGKEEKQTPEGKKKKIYIYI